MSTSRFTPGMRVALVLGSLLAAGAAPAQVEPDLEVGVSELCTTCNDVIRCERAPGLDGPEIVVYNLLEDDIWQQIATIWDYLVQFISPKTDDVRAMVIYELATADAASPRIIRDQQATVDAATLTIRLPGGLEIDQKTGRWQRSGAGNEAQELGRCTLLEFAAGRSLIEKLIPTNGNGENEQ